jgi:hypothetical protein
VPGAGKARPDQTGTTNLADMASEKLMRDPFGGYSRIREDRRLKPAALAGCLAISPASHWWFIRMISTAS